MAAGVTRRFKQAQRTVGEVTKERTRVVDANGFHLSSLSVHAFFHKCLSHRSDVFDRAVQPNSRIDAMREQVAGYAATGSFHVQTPGSRAALRDVGVDRPVLQEVSTVMEDFAELARVDYLLGQCHCGNATVIVPNHVGYTGLFNRLAHLFAFGNVHCQRLFTEDHLARFSGFNGDLFVQVVRCADIDRIDVITF